MPTIEELEAKLAQATAAAEKAAASVAKLEAKNKELADEKQKSKAEAEAAREAADTAAEEKARAAKDVEAVEKAVAKKYEKQIADLTGQLATTGTTLQTLLIDQAIQSTLVERGVLPELHEAATALFKSGAKIVDGQAVFGDTPLVDHINTYVASDKGKAFVAAPLNSGGNALGSKANGADTGPMTPAKLMELAATNPEKAAALRETVFKPS